jgi:P4 family phage/plasmid primase-like protien
VVHAKFVDTYKCVSFGKNVWFRFSGHVWHELDRGVQLQQELSTVVWRLYKQRAGYYSGKMIDGSIPMCSAKDRKECGCQFCECAEKEEAFNKICMKLKTTKYKENVMKECRELFLDELFVKKVDEDRKLLACANGVFDMKNMVFRDGKQEDYLSFSTGLDIDPQKHYTAYPGWSEVDKFLNQVLPNPIVRKYFLAHLSRCLDGLACQRFHILTGSGSNGKSMLMNLVETALGDYACKVPISLITQGRNKSSSASPEVVRLKGRRFVTMQEPDEAVPINTGIMKEITSSEKILSRDLYAGSKSMIEFELQCKFHLACNDKPKVNTNDGGTWRRLVVINFLSKFVQEPSGPNQFKMDITIEQKVKSESWGRAFLAYLIHVYKENAGQEIVPPDVVLEYTSEYREENDAITKFVRECTRKIEENEVVVAVRRETLTDSFKQWWESNRGTRDWKIQEMMKTIEQVYGKYTRGGWKTFQLQQDDE